MGIWFLKVMVTDECDNENGSCVCVKHLSWISHIAEKNGNADCCLLSCFTCHLLHPFDGLFSSTKNAGNFSDNSFIASSMAMASPT